MRFVLFLPIVVMLSGNVCAGMSTADAAEMDKGTQEKIDKKLAVMHDWAAHSLVVEAVKTQNAAMPSEYQGMTQEKWQHLGILDPLVRALTKNKAAQYLKSETQKDNAASEAFLSAADGTKVAFLFKPTNWCHKGKPKHDNPMQGKNWTGSFEVDESTGIQQLQLAVPVIDAGKPIGSLVVGFAVSKLK